MFSGHKNERNEKKEIQRVEMYSSILNKITFFPQRLRLTNRQIEFKEASLFQVITVNLNLKDNDFGVIIFNYQTDKSFSKIFRDLKG